MGRFKVEKPFQTKEEFVFETLREAILRLKLAPGEKLVSDRLSAELGVSPIPMRSALQRLEAEGLVRIIPFTGAVVAEITPQEVEEIFTILEALEQAAFEVAIRRGGVVAPRLEEILQEMAAALAQDDLSGWSELNRDFHLAVAETSEMKFLANLTRLAFDRWDRLRRYFFPQGDKDRARTAQTEHEQMVRALLRGDAAQLHDLVTAHNCGALRTYRVEEEWKK
jgi:DNA-binding GntR family transcriptional regulator